jgi:CTP synthase
MKLREIGLTPDFIFCRTEKKLTKSVREKLALFCNVSPDHVIEGLDVPSIYEVPLVLHKQKMGQEIMDRMELTSKPNIEYLEKFIYSFKNPTHEVNIAMCGKYTELPDAYKSILEAFVHAGVENNTSVNVKWVNTEKIYNDADSVKAFKNINGILIPGGFGSRGSEGKIFTSKYARENNIPFLGICLGLQCAVIDFARHVCGLNGANSTEFNRRTKYPVIALMESQRAIKRKGGTMRLGAYDCELVPGTKAYKAYRKKNISERHRHRWEVNNRFRAKLENNGLIFSGLNNELNLVEMIELKDHPWFVAGQFHPELKSRVSAAHPLFRDFVGAAVRDYLKSTHV